MFVDGAYHGAVQANADCDADGYQYVVDELNAGETYDITVKVCSAELLLLSIDSSSRYGCCGLVAVRNSQTTETENGFRPPDVSTIQSTVQLQQKLRCLLVLSLCPILPIHLYDSCCWNSVTGEE